MLDELSLLGELGGVSLHEVRVAVAAYLSVCTQDVVRRYLVDDLGRRDAEDLLLEDVVEPGSVVWEELAHLLTVEQALNDFSDVEAALHVEVGEGVVRVVEAARVLLLEEVHHLHDHVSGCEYLVGLLRRHVVEDILVLAVVEVVGELAAQVLRNSDRDGGHVAAYKELLLLGVRSPVFDEV